MKLTKKGNLLRFLGGVSCLAASIYFPGTGFLLYFLIKNRMESYKGFTMVALCVIQFIHILTFLGSTYGPLISHVGPEVKA